MAPRKPKQTSSPASPPAWRVTGSFRVAGVDPGGVVELDQLGEANIPALVEAGHLTPIEDQE